MPGVTAGAGVTGLTKAADCMPVACAPLTNVVAGTNVDGSGNGLRDVTAGAGTGAAGSELLATK